MKRLLGALLALALLAGPAHAVNPDEQLADPQLEARAEKLSRELRCVVCQNQTIDDSDAALAHDLRVILRERIAAGDTDQEAVDYLVARYGSFVELRPPLRADTVLLWFGPALLLLLGGAAAFVYVRGRSPRRAAALSTAEEAEFAELMKTDEAD
jgi:cytochrome c-type biogenesis protein CcmH